MRRPRLTQGCSAKRKEGLSVTCFGSDQAIIREKKKGNIYMRLRSLCTDKCDVSVTYIDGEGCTAFFRIILRLYRPICSLVLYLTDDGSILAEVC